MKSWRTITLVISILALAAVVIPQTSPGVGWWNKGRTESGAVLTQASISGVQTKLPPGFKGLKMLVGEWEGRNGAGNPLHASYRLTSGDSALVETLRPGGETEMTTVYSADGDRVAVTHFCSANNQPRMRTGAMTKPARQYVFEYIGATNLASPTAGHMHGLVLILVDDNHFSQQWLWKGEGKVMTDVFQFERKK
jgi:hypothetical protein